MPSLRFNLIKFHATTLLVFASFSAHSTNCLNILRDPRERDVLALHDQIFSFGDDFSKRHIPLNKGLALLDLLESPDISLKKLEGNLPKVDDRVFLKHKKEILANLAAQGTQYKEVPESKGILIQGGNSRLGRVAKSLKEKFGVQTFFDPNLMGRGAYHSDTRKVLLDIESILYPNQLSKTFLHEAHHAVNDFKSLFHVVISDGTDPSKIYSQFNLDEIHAFEKDVLHLQNSQIRPQIVGGEDKLKQAQKILYELSERLLKQKTTLLKVVSRINELEKNPEIENWDLDFKGFDDQVYIRKGGFVSKITPATRELFKLISNIHKDYQEEYIKRAHYSADHILRAIEIAEKRVAEKQAAENKAAEKHAGETL